MGSGQGQVSQRKLEKLKCILHYFSRVTKESRFAIALFIMIVY